MDRFGLFLLDCLKQMDRFGLFQLDCLKQNYHFGLFQLDQAEWLNQKCHFVLQCLILEEYLAHLNFIYGHHDNVKKDVDDIHE